MKPKLFFSLLFVVLAPCAPAVDFESLPPVLQRSKIELAEKIGLANHALGGLPAYVAAPENGVTLFADFDHATAGGSIPVYLINRTGKALRLDHQDRDVYLKLEFQEADGQWKRAQPHQLSRCGNSYFSTPLLHEHFVALAGDQPAGGERARLRFRLYRQTFDVVSNEGEGFFRRLDVEAAQRDEFAILGGSFDFLAAVARGELEPAGWSGRAGARGLAITELGMRSFPLEAVEKVLGPIASGEEEPLAKSAQQMLDQRKRNSSRF